MIRRAMMHARLLLPRPYARTASSWPLVSNKSLMLGHGWPPLKQLLQSTSSRRNGFWEKLVWRCFWEKLFQRRPKDGCACPHYQDEIKMSSTRWCHSSPENQELAKKSCTPCNSKDVHAMSEDSAKNLLEQVSGWELTTEGGILKLHRAWKVKNFVKGLEFFQLVAAIAEEEGHHPDLHLVGWNNVKIDVWTHSVRGLTDNDFILAAKINSLKLEGLLSKKATAKQLS